MDELVVLVVVAVVGGWVGGQKVMVALDMYARGGRHTCSGIWFGFW